MEPIPKVMTMFDTGPKKTLYNAGKILIVDDERFNCDIIDGFLMILGGQSSDNSREFAYNGE